MRISGAVTICTFRNLSPIFLPRAVTCGRGSCRGISVDHLSEAPENVAPWMKQSLLHEVQIVLSSRQSYVLGGHLTAKETFKLIKYYQEITDVVEQQYGNA